MSLLSFFFSPFRFKERRQLRSAIQPAPPPSLHCSPAESESNVDIAFIIMSLPPGHSALLFHQLSPEAMQAITLSVPETPTIAPEKRQSVLLQAFREFVGETPEDDSTDSLVRALSHSIHNNEKQFADYLYSRLSIPAEQPSLWEERFKDLHKVAVLDLSLSLWKQRTFRKTLSKAEEVFVELAGQAIANESLQTKVEVLRELLGGSQTPEALSLKLEYKTQRKALNELVSKNPKKLLVTLDRIWPDWRRDPREARENTA